MADSTVEQVATPVDVSLHLDLTDIRPISTSVSREQGFHRSFVALGVCSSIETDVKRRFRGKGARIVFAAPPADRLAAFAAEHGVSAACGHILIRKGVEPRAYPVYGASDPAIQVAIILDQEALDRAFETAWSAAARRVLGMSLTASSTTLVTQGLPFILPDDLDVSEDRAYPITDFSLTPMLTHFPEQADMRPARPQRDRQATTVVGLRVKAVRADLSSGDMVCLKIAAEGDLVSPRALKGMSVIVEILEYEHDAHGSGYPKEAAPGAFSYYPADKGGEAFLSLWLRFTARDFERLLPMLLTANAFLDVALGVPSSQFEAAREAVDGDVTSYTLVLHAARTP